MRQVWEAETGADVLVLREVLALAETDPQVAGTVLAALYAQRDDEVLHRILTRAEEAPLEPGAGAQAAAQTTASAGQQRQLLLRPF